MGSIIPPLTDDEKKFEDFIKSYSMYHKPVYIISKNNEGKPLLNNKKGKNQFPMYDLDKMCASCSIFRQGNISFLPKTTDALWSRKHENGNYYIYLVEFKGDKLYNKSNKCELVEYLDTLKKRLKDNPDDPYAGMDASTIERIIGKYSDRMLNGLALKPLETITIALPLLYQDYCRRNPNIEPFDIVGFLRNSEIIFRVVSLPENIELSSHNDQRNRANSYRSGKQRIDVCIKQGLEDEDYELLESYESNLKTYYKRYAEAEIICDTDNFLDTRGFNNFINNYMK